MFKRSTNRGRPISSTTPTSPQAINIGSPAAQQQQGTSNSPQQHGSPQQVRSPGATTDIDPMSGDIHSSSYSGPGSGLLRNKNVNSNQNSYPGPGLTSDSTHTEKQKKIDHIIEHVQIYVLIYLVYLQK